jgi:hypothetical protein
MLLEAVQGCAAEFSQQIPLHGHFLECFLMIHLTDLELLNSA